MRKQRKRYLGGFLAGLSCLFLLCGCHGSMGQSEFTVPEIFDESVQHEITFWAKNDTNKTQTEIYENPKVNPRQFPFHDMTQSFLDNSCSFSLFWLAKGLRL